MALPLYEQCCPISPSDWTALFFVQWIRHFSFLQPVYNVDMKRGMGATKVINRELFNEFMYWPK